MKKGGKNLKHKEIKIPIQVVAPKKAEPPTPAFKTEKEKVQKNKIVEPCDKLRIVRDKDDLPILDGAKFYKAKVGKGDLKDAKEDDGKKKDSEENSFKKEKRAKKKGGLAMMTREKKEKILIASVIGIVSIIFIVWVAMAKNNFFSALNQERKNVLFESNDLKNGFQELKNKLQEFGGGLEAKKEELKNEDTAGGLEEESKTEPVAAEDDNYGNEVIDKLKEKVLIEGVKSKLEK